MCSLVLKKFVENAYHEILREFRLSTQRSNLKILLSTGFLESYMLWNGYYQTSERTHSSHGKSLSSTMHVISGSPHVVGYISSLTRSG